MYCTLDRIFCCVYNKRNRTGRKITIDNSVRYIPQNEQTKGRKKINLKTSTLTFQ